MDSTLFYKAVSLSFLIHLAVISYFSTTPSRISPKPFKRIEVTYQTIKSREEKKTTSTARNLKIVQEEKFIKEEKFPLIKSRLLPPWGGAIKDVSKKSDSFRSVTKQSPRIKTLDSERKITIPFLKMEKITNPKYLGYHEIIRERIKQHAYLYIHHPLFQGGNVYLTFVVLSNGQLKQIQIIDEKTRANNDLRRIGLKSIEESVPFPPFPQDLQIYPELTFNVLISFEGQ